MFGGGRGGDEDEPDYYEEIGNMLLEGGYFRAQITTLAPFDKMVGGCARCKRSWAVATNTCASVVLLHVLCCCMCCCMCCVGATGAGGLAHAWHIGRRSSVLCAALRHGVSRWICAKREQGSGRTEGARSDDVVV